MAVLSISYDEIRFDNDMDMKTQTAMNSRTAMNKRTPRVKDNEKLNFRQVASGFIMAESIDGMPPGRRLAKTFTDQFNRRYVQINGEMELVTEKHCYLGME